MTGIFDDLQTIKKCLLKAEDMEPDERSEFLGEFADELISAMHTLCHKTDHFHQNRKISVFREFMIELEILVEFWTDRIEGEDLMRKIDYAKLMKREVSLEEDEK